MMDNVHRVKPRTMWISAAILGTACLTIPFTVASCDAEVEIASLSEVAGKVNGAEMIGTIDAKISTAVGGTSTCTYTQLPRGFTAATLGTHT